MYWPLPYNGTPGVLSFVWVPLRGDAPLKKQFILIGGFIIAAILIVLHVKNMMIPIFHIGTDVYKRSGQFDDLTAYYCKSSGNTIIIKDREEYIEIHIGDEIYKVYGQPTRSTSREDRDLLTIEHPDGRIVKGWYSTGTGLFLTKKDTGEMETEFPTFVTVTGTGQKSSDENTSNLKNGTLVKIAFESCQRTNGDPSKFIPGILLLIIGFINFRYPKFFFYLRHGLWVENPEPNELYLTLARGGGVVSCVLGVLLVIFSVEVF